MNLRPAATLGSITAIALGGLLLAVPAQATQAPAPAATTAPATSAPTPTLTAPQQAAPVDAVRSWLLPDGGTPNHVTWPQIPVDPSKCVIENPGWIQQDFLHGFQSAIDELSAPDSPAGVDLAQGEDSALYVRHVWVRQIVCAPQPTPTPTETSSTPSSPSPTSTPSTPAPTSTAPAPGTPLPSATPSTSPTSPSTPSASPSPVETTATGATPSGPASSATAAAATGDRAGLNKQLADNSLAMTGSDTTLTSTIALVLLIAGGLIFALAYGPGVIRRIRTRR